jgi:hypothetical protein
MVSIQGVTELLTRRAPALLNPSLNNGLETLPKSVVDSKGPVSTRTCESRCLCPQYLVVDGWEGYPLLEREDRALVTVLATRNE